MNSDSPFIPLVPRSNSPAAPASGTSQSPARNEGPSAFQPLSVSLAAPASGAPGPKSAKPLITLKREGERVTQIRIQCACGQVIELDCIY